MNDVFEDAVEDNSPNKCDDPQSPKEIEVGDEVEIHITTQGIGERSWEYVWPHIGTVAARWRCLEGSLWAIVEIVRTVAQGKSSNATHSSDYLGCKFLARSYLTRLGLAPCGRRSRHRVQNHRDVAKILSTWKTSLPSVGPITARVTEA